MQEMSLTSFWIIAGSCVLVLGIMILKNRARFALNFLVRAVLGACAIACVNKWLAQQGIMLAVIWRRRPCGNMERNRRRTEQTE